MNESWAPAEPNGRYNFESHGADGALLGEHGGAPVRIPCPAGTLILFDGTVPHGTASNYSARGRCIIFLRYITAPQLPLSTWRERNAAIRRIAEQLGWTPDERQSKHLYGPG